MLGRIEARTATTMIDHEKRRKKLKADDQVTSVG